MSGEYLHCELTDNTHRISEILAFTNFDYLNYKFLYYLFSKFTKE